MRGYYQIEWTLITEISRRRDHPQAAGTGGEGLLGMVHAIFPAATGNPCRAGT